MADNFSTKISKTLLAHDINLAKVDAAMRADVLAVMKGLELKTIENITKVGTTSGLTTATAQNKALNVLVSATASDADKAFKQMSDVTGVSLTKLGAVESEFTVNTLNRAMTVDLGLNKLSPEVIRLLPGKALIEGAPFTTWFVKQNEDFQLAFSNQMREGIVNGETIDDMVRRVRGTRAGGFKDGIMETSRRNAQTLVRSSALATVNKARESVYKANSHVIKGQQWLSTLDSRTSDICISLDGSAWYLSGKPMEGTVHSYLGPPPAHFNCRSTLVPVTKSFSELSKDKKVKDKLRKIPKAKQRGLRASMDGAVSNKLNYEEWLRSKGPGFQLKVLGPTKLRLWQAGQLSLRKLIDQSHNPMKVDKLVADVGVPKITLDQALDTAAVAEIPVPAHGVVYKSSKQWYDEFADKSATKESVLANFDAKTVAKLDETQVKINASPPTNVTHKINGKWTAERKKVHDKIVRDFLNKATVAAAKPAPGQKPSYVMFGGRGSSGKGAFTTPKTKGGLEVIDQEKYIVLDSDAIKGMLPGFDGWNAYHYHAESSELFARITEIAARLKINVVHDITMRGQSAFKRSKLFMKKGYDMEGYYMFLPPQTAASRTIQRFKGFKKPPTYNGRYVPPDVVLGMTDNEAAFDAMKKHFKKWQFYDNQGSAPVLVGSGGDFGAATVKSLSSVATKAADDAAKAAAKVAADDAAATAAAKAAAKAADEAAAAVIAKEAAEAEAVAAKAAQEAAEKAAAFEAKKAKELAEAKDQYIKDALAGEVVDSDVAIVLGSNMTNAELGTFVKEVKVMVDAQKAAAKKLADMQQTFMTDFLAGKPAADDVFEYLLDNMTPTELSVFKKQAKAAKEAIEAAAKEAAEAAAKEAAVTAAEANSAKVIESIKAQKATFEKRAYVKLVKADPEFVNLPALEQLEFIAGQVEVDKAAKKITDGISNYKKAVINGKVPPPAATKVFNALDPEKQQSIIDDIAKKTGQQQAAATPPTLAESLAQYDAGKMSNAEWIEAYNKAKGTYTLDVQKAILSAPDTVLADTAETLAQQAAATVGKAQTSAPGMTAGKLQQSVKDLLNENIAGEWSASKLKLEAGKLLGEDLMQTAPMSVLNKLVGIVEDSVKAEAHLSSKIAATPTAKIVSKTVAQIQDEAQDFIDKFRFGEFDEKEAIEKAAAIMGKAKLVPGFMKLNPQGIDNVLDILNKQVKKVATNIDDAKAAIKKQGLKVGDDIEAAVAPPKPPPPPEPKPVAPAPASPVNNAPDIDNLTRIGEQKGSNPGGLFQDSTTGEKWYVKTPASEEIARNEVLAAKLYEKMGIEVPDLHTVQFGGKPSVASRIVDGLSENSTALRAGEVVGVNEGFVADAFLANWDVVGLGYDNLLVKAGRAIRVDTGGALRYRAQGGLKGNAFGKTVGEIDSLRNPANNSQSAGVFGRISDAELKAGARKVVNLTDDDIKGLVTTYGPLDPVENKALIDTLIARRNDIKKRFKIRAKKQPPAKAPNDVNADITASELQMIDEGRGNGFVLNRDKDGIEDQAILAWNETTVKGTKRSMLQMKVRGDATKTLTDSIESAVQKPPVEVRTANLDTLVGNSVRGLKHRAAQELDFDQTILVRVNDAIDEHDRVRALLVDGLAQGGIGQATLTKFDETYAIWAQKLKVIRGRNGVGGKVQAIDELPRGRFESGVMGDIDIYPPAPKGDAEFKWTLKRFSFEEKQLKNGNVMVTGKRRNPIRADGGYYETKIDGVTVRYFSKDSVKDNFALQDRLEIIAPGKTHEQGLAVLRKLGINVDRATEFDAEELYLRQIMQHATSSLDIARRESFNEIISELAGIADDGARLQRARVLASKHIGVDDITKTPAYNYRGQYQAFNQGQRHLTRPDLNGMEWDVFNEEYLLHHRNTSNSTLPQVIDMVLNSGGNFISTTDKIRRGVALQGMSPDSDLRTGGASYFFTRIKTMKNARQSDGIVWRAKHLKRLDSISYNHDAYGEVADNYAALHRRTGIKEWADVTNRDTNETIFKNGLSLFDDLDMIVTRTKGERDEILDIFKKHGLSEWPDGRKLTDIVKWKGDNI